MTSFELRTSIRAPVQLVFGLARDIGFHERSMVGTREQAVAGRTSGPIALGETVTWRARHFRTWWTLQSRITAMTPFTGFADEQVHGPFAWFRHEHRLEGVDGGTLMTDLWQHASPLGPLGWLADLLILRQYMRRLLETRNAALKEEAERLADQAAPTAVSAAWTARNSGSSGSTSTSHDAIRSVPDGAANS